MEMLGTSAGVGLWLCVAIGPLSGLMAIGISSSVGQEIIKLDPATAAGLVSFFALFNGAGRPIFGWLTDAIGPARAAAISFLLILMASVGMLMAGQGSLILYVLCFSAFWMGLGSWLAIAPTSTATFFGPGNYSANYGVIFSAYGIGAIAAGFIAGAAKDLLGSYQNAFWVTGGLAACGLVLALTLMKKPATLMP
jgi:OFA family oxalate/formate antiporter-like MFS transporter